MFKRFLFLLILAYFSQIHLQAQSIIWQKSLGGSNDDAAKSIRQTFDGGYIVAGYSMSWDGDLNNNYGQEDFWIVKLDSTGHKQWQHIYGGSQGDGANCVRQTADSGYIAAGYTNSADGDVSYLCGYYDYWVIKTDKQGNLKWEKTLGGNTYDEAKSIEQTNDGGYIVAGGSWSDNGEVTNANGYFDYWVVKLDTARNIQWEKAMGGSDYDEAEAIQQTSDGGYIVAGGSASSDSMVTGNHGNYDFWIVKLDTAGNIQWKKALGGTGADYAYSIKQTADGGYIAAGESNSNDGDVTGNHGDFDYWVVKLDSAGALQWEQSYGGSGADIAYSVQQTKDKGYMVAGASMSIDGDVTNSHGGYDYWVVKLDATGNIQWQRSLGGSDDDRAYSIEQTKDGKYIIAGGSLSTDGDITVYHGNYDFWVVKLDINAGVAEFRGNVYLYVYPNPVTDKVNVAIINATGKFEINVIDLQGQNVLSQSAKANRTGLNASIYTGGLRPGIYILKISGENINAEKKLVIE